MPEPAEPPAATWCCGRWIRGGPAGLQQHQRGQKHFALQLWHRGNASWSTCLERGAELSTAAWAATSWDKPKGPLEAQAHAGKPAAAQATCSENSRGPWKASAPAGTQLLTDAALGPTPAPTPAPPQATSWEKPKGTWEASPPARDAALASAPAPTPAPPPAALESGASSPALSLPCRRTGPRASHRHVVYGAFAF